MIPFLDIGMVAWVNDRLSGINCHVVWGPPEVSKQRLARDQQQNQQKNDRGLPGATIFRTGTQLLVNTPSGAVMGYPAGRNEEGDYYRLKTVKVLCDYSFVAWTRNLNEMNKIEREVWFLGQTASMAHPVSCLIKCKDAEDNEFETTWKFPVILKQEPTYSRIVEEKTGNITWYGLECSFQSSGEWLNSHINPRILQINIDFQELLDDEWTLIEQVQILPREEN